MLLATPNTQLPAHPVLCYQHTLFCATSHAPLCTNSQLPATPPICQHLATSHTPILPTANYQPHPTLCQHLATSHTPIPTAESHPTPGYDNYQPHPNTSPAMIATSHTHIYIQGTANNNNTIDQPHLSSHENTKAHRNTSCT